MFEERKQDWMQQAQSVPKPDPNRWDNGGMGVLDTFCGQGALLLALVEEEVAVDSFYAVDDDPVAGLMLMETVLFCLQHEHHRRFVAWEAVAHMFDTWGDVRRLQDLDLHTLKRIDVIGSGPPCQPFSRANPRARGWDDPRASLFIVAVELIHRVVALGERQGRPVVFLLENVEPSPRLVGYRDTMDELVGVKGVMWDSGRLIASARKRVWWTNAPGYDEPLPDCPRVSSLAEVLAACGGHHLPREAERADQFNTAGAPVVVTATVMASAVTKSDLLPPAGTGTGCHYNVASGALEPLFAVERFGVMSWPPAIAARAIANGVPHAHVCHSIGNSWAIQAVRHWIRHWHGSLLPVARMNLTSSSPFESGNGSDGTCGGANDSGNANDLSGSDGHGGKLGSDVSELYGEDLGVEECFTPPGPTWERGEYASLLSPDGDAHEAGDPQLEQHGWSVPEEGGFAVPRGPTEADSPAAARLHDAAAAFQAAEFDPVPEENDLRERMRAVMRAIRRECALPPEERVQPPLDEVAREILEIRAECLDPEKFQANRYQLHVAAWDEMCREMRRMGFQADPVTKRQKAVLTSLRDGVRPRFWDIARGFDEGHRAFGRRFRALKRELAALPGVGEAGAEGILQGKMPPRMHFANRPSIVAHHDYVVDTVVDLLRCGAARIWAAVPHAITQGEMPWVISPLSVAVREKDKKRRLCIDIRYLNLWLRHLSVKFDSVRDLVAMVDRMQHAGATEVVVCCSDMKSGYFHVPIAEECWRFFAFKVDGVVCCYTCLSFGFAQSPRFYCAAEGLKHEAYRAMGVSLAEYIDDSARPYRDRAESLAVERLLLRMGTLLGGYYSFGQMTRGERGEVFFSKMVLWPSREVEFLGFQLDLARRTIAVPETKLLYLEQRIEGWLAQELLSPRDMARFAGLLVSIQPAIPFSKGLARDALRAVTGVASWDEAFMPPPALRVVMRWLLMHMRAWNGTHWYAYPAGLRLIGDYSPNGTGGVIAAVQLVEGDCNVVWRSAARDLPIEVVSTFSPADMAAIARGEMSSVRGELVAALHLVIVALAEAPDELIRGRTLVYTTDGQAAILALTRMYSPVAAVHDLVLELHARVLSRGGRLEGRWVPREFNREADVLSKLEDSSSWRLNWNVAKWVWATLLAGSAYARPSIDAFADPGNHMCHAFIARWPCQGAMAVDAMLQGELLARPVADTGLKPLVHVNPPWCLWPEVVQLIRHWRINCILIYPVFRGAGFAEIEALPLAAGPLDLPQRRNLFTAGTRVPAKDLGKARFRARAALVLWK